eukprot:6080173-Amphidinium_carterae.1
MAALLGTWWQATANQAHSSRGIMQDEKHSTSCCDLHGKPCDAERKELRGDLGCNRLHIRAHTAAGHRMVLSASDVIERAQKGFFRNPKDTGGAPKQHSLS